MLLIDYNNLKDKFFIKICERLDYEEFNNIITFFKKLFLFYDVKDKNWYLSKDRIDEIELWFKNFNYEYDFTSKAFVEKINFLDKIYARKTETYRNLIFDENVLNKTSFTAYQFQKQGIDWMVKRGNYYCADDAGLGKTFETISVFSKWHKEKIIDSVFLIVRNGLSYHWKRQILQYSNQFKEDDIQIINNKNKENIFDVYKDKKILIVANHLLAPSFCFYKFKNNKKTRSLKRIHWDKYVDINKEWNKDKICLVVDEAHEFKNSKSIKTKALLSHIDFFKNKILLSATPAINGFEDWWVGLNIIDPSILKMSENAFKINISNSIGNKWSMYAINSYNEYKIKQIVDKFPNYVIKRLKKDVDELKAKQIIKPIYFEMPSSQYNLYLSFLQYEILKLEKEKNFISLKEIFYKFPYLLLCIDNPLILKGKVENDKFNKLLDKWKFEQDERFKYLKSTLENDIENNNQKVIIFDNHPITLNLLKEQFEKYNPLIVHGQIEDNEESRQQKQDLFNDKFSENKLFLLSTSIGGAGWNLNKACSKVIFWSLPYDSILVRQALDRTHRIDSVNDSLIEILLLDHSIDIIRYEKTINRIEFNDNILNSELTPEKIKKFLDGSLNLTNK